MAKSYRERIAFELIRYFRNNGNKPTWTAVLYHAVFAIYPKHVTLRMVASVLRCKDVFEEHNPVKKRYGRQYAVWPSLLEMDDESIVLMVGL